MSSKDQLRNLVTQSDFSDLAQLQPIEVYLLLQDNQLPIVRKDGTDLIDLNDMRARRFLRDYQKPKDLF